MYEKDNQITSDICSLGVIYISFSNTNKNKKQKQPEWTLSAFSQNDKNTMNING